MWDKHTRKHQRRTYRHTGQDVLFQRDPTDISLSFLKAYCVPSWSHPQRCRQRCIKHPSSCQQFSVVLSVWKAWLADWGVPQTAGDTGRVFTFLQCMSLYFDTPSMTPKQNNCDGFFPNSVELLSNIWRYSLCARWRTKSGMEGEKCCRNSARQSHVTVSASY